MVFISWYLNNSSSSWATGTKSETWILIKASRKPILIQVIPQRLWHKSVTLLDYMKLFHPRHNKISTQINSVAIDIFLPIKIN